MLTMCDETAGRSRSHGLRPEVLDAQAEALGLRRVVRPCSWATYDAAFVGALGELAAGGITHVVFGDILFDEHRRWAEAVCAAHGLVAVEPLFGSSTATLFDEWTASGADAIIVTARAFGAKTAGRSTCALRNADCGLRIDCEMEIAVCGLIAD